MKRKMIFGLLVLMILLAYFVVQGIEQTPTVHIDRIKIIDPATSAVETFDTLLSDDAQSFVLVLDLQGCDYCNGKSMSLLAVKSQIAPVSVLVCDDFNENVLAWSVHYPDIPIFRGETGNFITNSSLTRFPLLLEYRGHKLVYFKSIDVRE